MIQAGFVFPSSNKRKMLEMILHMPSPLCPTKMRVGEDEPGRNIANKLKEIDDLAQRKSGFFLDNEQCSYDINIMEAKPIKLACFFDVPYASIRTIMTRLAEAGPEFGYACLPEERKEKNMINNQIGVNSIDSWVGRNIDKFLPGVYWWTLVSSSLAGMHNVPLAALSNAAVEHIEVRGSLHLFRFYDQPEDWRAADNIRKLVAKCPGIFNIDDVRGPMAQAKTVLELFDISRQWVN